MKRRRLLLVISTALFLGWIGWLAFLVFGTPRPTVVLSRPQFLVSELDVVAEVADLHQPVVIDEVAHPDSERGKAGEKVLVENLSDCEGYQGPGQYILPLIHVLGTGGQYTAWVAPTPPSPGYPGGKPRVYPATPETLEQLRQVPKATSMRLDE